MMYTRCNITNESKVLIFLHTCPSRSISAVLPLGHTKIIKNMHEVVMTFVEVNESISNLYILALYFHGRLLSRAVFPDKRC